MSLKRRLKLFCLILILGVLTLLIYHWFGLGMPLRANIPTPVGNNIFASAAQTRGEVPAPAAKSKAAKATRRDADFWPQEPHPVAFRRRTLLPRRTFRFEKDVDPEQRIIWIVQFGGPLDDGDCRRLQALGLEALLPTVSGAYHLRASAQALSFAAARFEPKILGWERLQPNDKLMSAVHNMPDVPEGRWRLELYPGSEIAKLIQTIRSLGGEVLNEYHAQRVEQGLEWLEVGTGVNIAASGAREFLLRLAGVEDVYMIDLPRSPLRSLNQQAAANSNITPIFTAPYNLSGAGVTVMVRDEGRIFAHPDFGSRLLLGPDVVNKTPDQHATHVAGSIGGNGLNDPTSQARGMASGCTLLSYDLKGDDVNEPLQAKSMFGAVLSNHSYGFVVGWDSSVFHNNQSDFGTYGSFALNWDSIIKSENLIMVKAVGNDRNDSGPGHPHDGTLAADGEYYDTVDSSSTAKNILAVGAASDACQAGSPSAGIAVLPFSSSGPCNDGRLKPELIANGDTVFSCNNSSAPGNLYLTLTGTSMAAAVVSGASALFMERYRQRFNGANCTPYYLRAVYAQTATDMGRPGPDYLHGFGMLDLSAAIALLDQDTPGGSRVANGSITADTPEHFYVLASDGSAPIKGTLCWNDAAGDPLAARALVNDLDLRLVRADDQSVFLPFVLDPTQPAQPAGAGVNKVDNIEQVLVSAPAAGNYLLAVRGTSLATPVDFALASSHRLHEDLAPLAAMKASRTFGPPPLFVSFDGSGSSDSDGNVVRYLWTFGDGQTAEGATVTHSYSQGNYQAVLTVFDTEGASASTSTPISVINQLPQVMLAATPASGPPPLSILLTSAGSFDPDGAIVDFTWDFGDGSSGNGAMVTHMYTAPGLYFARLTATDDNGGTTQQSVAILAGFTFQPDASRFTLNLKKPGHDSFNLRTRNLGIAPEHPVAGVSGAFQLGNAEYTFTLDEHGAFHSAPLTVRLNAAKNTLKVVLANTDLEGTLAASGATNRDASKELIGVPLAFSLNSDSVWGSSGLSYTYTARLGRSGRGVVVKP